MILPTMGIATYSDFLAAKAQYDGDSGFDPVWLPDFLFDFQRALVDWAIRKGRAAIFADCGLGKTPMQLVWAENVVRHTNGRVLIVTPLAVGAQTIAEAKKFGIECVRSRDGKIPDGAKIIVTNYEQLHHFQSGDFAGCVCDESSILKNFDGARRAIVQEFLRRLPYRLLCTATAAPNDYVELGTSSEALGYLGHMDMLARFFKNDQNSLNVNRLWAGAKWRFKRHAQLPFWRWVCSWARAVRKPSDLGYDDGAFILPSLTEHEHMVAARTIRDGFLFDLPAVGLKEQREERRRTIDERCEKAAALVASTSGLAIVWCHLNAEGDLLEELIPGSVQVKGADSDQWKEAASEWFVGTKCICMDEMFYDKLATWEKEQSAIGSNSILSIESSGSGNHVPTSTNTATKERPTSQSITPPTSHVTSSRQPSSKSADAERGSATHPIRSSESCGLQKPSAIENSIPRPESRATSSDTELVSNNTGYLPLTDVESAEDARVMLTKEPSGSILTTVTKQADSVDSSVLLVTSDSESLPTIQSDLREPPCICGHASGRRVLISKARIFGYGLNFQGCSHVVSFPSHSYEQYYQSVRRCWRFGQERPVIVDLVVTEGELDVLKNLQRKSQAADLMFSQLVACMGEAMHIGRSRAETHHVEAPSWL